MTIKRAYDNWPEALDIHEYNVRKLHKKLHPIRLDELNETTVHLDSGGIEMIPLPSRTVLRDLGDLTFVVPESFNYVPI